VLDILGVIFNVLSIFVYIADFLWGGGGIQGGVVSIMTRVQAG
jgi:hypothetical protein